MTEENNQGSTQNEEPKKEAINEEKRQEMPVAEDEKISAALSYVWILVLIPLLLKKNSKFAQFHAKQGLVLCVIELLGMFIFWFPLFGQLLGLLTLLAAIYGFIKAYNGEWYKMPLVYEWGEVLNDKLKL